MVVLLLVLVVVVREEWETTNPVHERSPVDKIERPTDREIQLFME